MRNFLHFMQQILKQQQILFIRKWRKVHRMFAWWIYILYNFSSAKYILLQQNILQLRQPLLHFIPLQHECFAWPSAICMVSRTILKLKRYCYILYKHCMLGLDFHALPSKKKILTFVGLIYSLRLFPRNIHWLLLFFFFNLI